MPKKKKIEEKIEFKPEAFMSMTDTMIEKYVAKLINSYALVTCLKEFGISGMRLLAFVTRLSELTLECDEKNGTELDGLIEECGQ